MNLNRPHIVIIGAGVSGLTAAFRLNQAGYQTTILEKSTQPGGQLATTELNVSNLRARPLPIEHYYHHVFRGDIHLIKLCDELNIANALEWRDSTMGYYTQNKLHKFGTPLSLLRFTPLSVINRLKFIGSVLRLQFLTSQSRAEQWAAYTWFQKQGYSTVWNIIWKPLFDMKFGEWADRISLVWLWDKLQMRGKSRGKSGNSEQLGYMQGSFKTLCDALSKKVLSGGTQLRLNASIDQILHDRETGKFRIKTSDGDIEADKVICTTSARILERIVPFSEAFQKKLNQYRYTYIYRGTYPTITHFGSQTTKQSPAPLSII
ncbi:FAD-dependent oxidoreductase [bacterium]|nr:FAD-dependent oxidoreductase [bacterium]